MSLYEQSLPRPASAPVCGALPTGAGEGGPFPPDWVKTPEDYDAWFRAGIQKALDNPGPTISHEEAMARLDGLLDRLCPR